MRTSADVAGKLEEHSEVLMALEILTVEQTCRLLALESIVAQLVSGNTVDREALKNYIAEQAPRYQKNFEGSGLSGLLERSLQFAEGYVSRSS